MNQGLNAAQIAAALAVQQAEQGIQPPGAAVLGALPLGDGASPVPNVGDDVVVHQPLVQQLLELDAEEQNAYSGTHKGFKNNYPM